jgi:hypothetical protein
VVGINTCGINTMAPVGTTFTISFLVYNTYQLSSTVHRTITITDPCVEVDKSYFCGYSDGTYKCIGAPCSYAAAFTEASPEPPTLQLLPAGASTIYIPYGSSLPFSLEPCSGLADSVVDNSVICGAMAVDPAETSAENQTPTDITSQITTINTTPCRYYFFFFFFFTLLYEEGTPYCRYLHKLEALGAG